ncbi:protein ALP1-like [Senna tora]|uniref:Protein ALP1-like n=1 Tax=Senna tora TaxID=362788 RepID=A0A835CEN9_9FABA|nr:protein ALP1-like [Senna tora]
MHEALSIALRRNRLRMSFTLEFHEKRTRLRSLVYSNDSNCYNVLRIYRNTFDRLCSMLDEIGVLKPTKHMLVDEQVAMCALDGTHVKIRVGPKEQTRFRNRKGDVTINILGVCSQDAQFIYVMSGWEGYAADSRVFKSALNRPRGFKVPSGYSNAQGVLAPFRGQRYHLNEWREGRHPTNSRECFNMRHLSARNVIKRCFEMLKNWWTILRSPSYYTLQSYNIIVITCCLFHKLIHRENARDPLDNEAENLVPEPAEEPVEEPAEDDPSISTIERQSEEWIHKLITLTADPQSTIEEDATEAPRMLVEGNPTHIVKTQDTGEELVDSARYGSHPDAKQFRYKPFPYLSDLTKVWGKDGTIKGEARDAEDINDIPDEDLDGLEGLENNGQNQTLPGQHLLDDMIQPPPSNCEAVLTSCKRKRTSPSNDVIEGFKEVAEPFLHCLDKIAEGIGRNAGEKELDQKRAALCQALAKVDGLTDDELVRVHLRLSSYPAMLVAIFGLEDRFKLRWLQQIIGCCHFVLAIAIHLSVLHWFKPTEEIALILVTTNEQPVWICIGLRNFDAGYFLANGATPTTTPAATVASGSTGALNFTFSTLLSTLLCFFSDA